MSQPFPQIKRHPEEMIELAKSFPQRAEMIRDFLICYQPLCARRVVEEHGMASLVDQFIMDILKVQEEFQGKFPLAIGEISGEEDAGAASSGDEVEAEVEEDAGTAAAIGDAVGEPAAEGDRELDEGEETPS